PVVIPGKGAFYSGKWSFGWDVPKRQPGAYVVKRPGYFGSREEQRFPLTSDGWGAAWLVFSTKDPEGARVLSTRWGWVGSSEQTGDAPPAEEEPFGVVGLLVFLALAFG